MMPFPPDIRKLPVVTMVGLVLSGCGGWWGGGKEQTRLEGKRIDVLRGGSNLKKDSRISDLDVLLPRPKINEDWPQAGGYPNHAMHHLAASGPLAQVWNADIGEGTNDEAQLLAQPVVAGNRVYTVDTKAEVSAFIRDRETVSGKSHCPGRR